MRKALLTGLASLFLLACSLFIISACSSKNVESITIDTNSLPQTTYVVGSPLDRSKGRLRLDDGNYVLLSDPDVTITGYDQNTLGEQTLTITYAGAQTQLKVNVVPRFQTAQEKYVYFVGEDFWDANPSIIVTRNDGTQIAVTDRNSISFADGDFADTYTAKAADNVNVNITYASGTDNYSGPITIQVCDPVYDFRAPTDLEYGNYETSLNTSGVRLTITNENNTASRNVSTADITFSGFDPAGAKVDEDNTKVTQTVKVLYKGVDIGKSFTVTIVYDSASKFLEVAEKLPEEAAWDCYSFGGEDIALFGLPEEIADNAELQREAFEAMQLYVDDIKNDQRKFISRDNLNKVARVATVYGYNTWFTTAHSTEALADAVLFYFDMVNSTDSDELVTAVASYAPASAPSVYQTAIDYLNSILPASDTDPAKESDLLVAISDLLKSDDYLDACGDTRIYLTDTDENGDDIRFINVDFLASMLGDRSFLREVSYELRDAIKAYDTLLNITFPTEHSERLQQNNINALDNNKTEIEATYALLYNIANQTTDAYDPSIYVAINGWRENDDFFEILYRYYYNQLTKLDENAADYEDQNEELTQILVNLMTYMAPMPIYNIQVIHSTAYNMYSSVYNNQIIEATPFFLALRELENAKEDFFDTYVNEEDEANFDMLYALVYSTVIENQYMNYQLSEMYYGEGGYNYLLSYAAYDGTVEQVLINYLDVVSRYAELLADNTTGDDSSVFDDTNFVAAVKEMFDNFVRLDMIQQNYFLNAISYLHTSGIPEMILVPTDGYYPQFTGIIYSYFATKFQPDGEADISDTAWNIFENMMYALEGYYNSDTDYFNTYMAEAADLYNNDEAWVGVSKLVFDEELGDIYNYLLEIHGLFVEDEPEEGEETTTWSLAATLTKEESNLLAQLDEKLSLLSSFLFMENYDYDYSLAYISVYEEVRRLEAEILSGSKNLINAYNYMQYGESDLFSSNILAIDVYDKHGELLNKLDLASFDYTVYESADYAPLRAFLANNSSYLLTATVIFYESLGFGGEDSQIPQIIEKTFTFTADNVKALLNEYLSLTADAKFMLYQLDTYDIFMTGLVDGIEFADKTVEGTVTSAERDLADAILNISGLYLSWLQTDDGTVSYTDEDGNVVTIDITKSILDAYDEVLTDYAALEATAKTDFDSYFADFYKYVTDSCEEVKAASEEQGSGAEEGETVTEALAA